MLINTKLTPISLCTKNNYYLTRKEILTMVNYITSHYNFIVVRRFQIKSVYVYAFIKCAC